MAIPIYVPTKGRPNARLLDDLTSEGLQCVMVVEESQVEIYRAAQPFHEILSIPDDVTGPFRARQAALRHARATGFAWHWQLDDDLAGLAIRADMAPETRYANTSWVAGLQWMETYALQHPTVALAGPVQTQFGWAADKAWRFNTRVNAAMLIGSGARGKFRGDALLKEDWDFALQVLSAGQDTMLFQQIGVKTTQGTGTGGCQPLYEAGQGTEAAYRLAALWPQNVTVTEKFGRIDNRIDFKPFKRPVPRREAA